MSSSSSSSTNKDEYLAPFATVYKHVVMWGEMDVLGHVNNTAYLGWMVEAAQRYSTNTQKLAEETGGNIPGTDFVLARVAINFRRPVVYPATVFASVRTTRVGSSSFEQDCVIRCLDSDGEMYNAADGTLVYVLINVQKGKPVAMTASYKLAIAKIDGLELQTDAVKASL